MKKIYLIILLVWISTVFSQSPEDSVLLPGYASLNHLTPTKSYAQMFNVGLLTNAYILKENESINLEYITYPSFRSPSVTYIIENFQTNTYRVAHTFSKKDLVKSKKRHINTKFRVINKEIVNQVNSIYEQLLIDVHYPKENKNFLGMDGTIYQFYVNGMEYGQMYGETWSPQVGTKTDYLVKISESLIQYTNGKINEDELMVIIKEFKNMISTPQLSQYEYNEFHSLCRSESEMSTPLMLMVQ